VCKTILVLLRREQAGKKSFLRTRMGEKNLFWWRWVIEKDCTPVDGKDEEGGVWQTQKQAGLSRAILEISSRISYEFTLRNISPYIAGLRI
jgi:hypothetical protein